MTELAGKDYFTVREAATYAGVSYSHWRSKIQPGFPPGEFFGRLLYRRVDVARFLEQRIKWPLSTGEPGALTSIGPKAVDNIDDRSGGSRRMRPKSAARRRSLSSRPASASSSRPPALKIISRDT